MTEGRHRHRASRVKREYVVTSHPEPRSVRTTYSYSEGDGGGDGGRRRRSEKAVETRTYESRVVRTHRPSAANYIDASAGSHRKRSGHSTGHYRQEGPRSHHRHYGMYQPHSRHPHHNQYTGGSYYNHRSKVSGRFIQASDRSPSPEQNRRSSSKGFIDYLKEAFGGYGPDKETASESGKKSRGRRRPAAADKSYSRGRGGRAPVDGDEYDDASSHGYSDEDDVGGEDNEYTNPRSSKSVKGGGRGASRSKDYAVYYDDAAAAGEDGEDDMYGEVDDNESDDGHDSEFYDEPPQDYVDAAENSQAQSSGREGSSSVKASDRGSGRQGSAYSSAFRRTSSSANKNPATERNSARGANRDRDPYSAAGSSDPSGGGKGGRRNSSSRGSGESAYGGRSSEGRSGRTERRGGGGGRERSRPGPAAGGYGFNSRCCDPCARPKPLKRCCPTPAPKCCDPAALYESGDGNIWGGGIRAGGSGGGGEGRGYRRGRSCSLRAGGNGRSGDYGNLDSDENGGRNYAPRGRPRAVSARIGNGGNRRNSELGTIRDRSERRGTENYGMDFGDPRAERRRDERSSSGFPSSSSPSSSGDEGGRVAPGRRRRYADESGSEEGRSGQLHRMPSGSHRPMYVPPSFIFDDDDYFGHQNIRHRLAGDRDDDPDSDGSYDEDDPVVPPFFKNRMGDKQFTRLLQLHPLTQIWINRETTEFELLDKRYFVEIPPAPQWGSGGRVRYDPGNMYVTKPRGEATVWVRSAKQSQAVVTEMTREALRKSLEAHSIPVKTVIIFLVDAALRVCARLQAGEPKALANPLPDVLSRQLVGAAPLLDNGPLTPAKGLTGSVLRGHYGSLILWPALRGTTLVFEYIRYAVAAQMKSEIFIGARTCNEATTLSGFDLDAMSACLTCGVVAAAAMARYLYLFVGFGLHPDSKHAAFDELFDVEKYVRNPLGSRFLVAVESVCFGDLDGQGDVQAGIASSVISAYMASRSVFTEIASYYSELQDDDVADQPDSARERAAMIVNMSSFLQKFLGHLNVLMCHLGIAAMYHGMEVKIHAQAVAIYEYVMQLCSPLYEGQSIAQFVSGRETAMRDLGLMYAAGNPPSDDDSSLTLFNTRDVDALRITDYRALPELGPMVSFTDAMSGHAEAILGRDVLRAAKEATYSRKLGGRFR